MPRYYFHIQAYDGQLIEDEEGSDLPDDATALEEAIASTHDLAADAARSRRRADKSIMLTNQAGDVLHTIYVRTTIT
jgi:hypothetical protein